MKRILIGVLLVILGTSYIVQKELVIKRILILHDKPRHYIVITEKPKVSKPRQEVELMAYPAPPDEQLPPYPPPDSSPIRTTQPTPTPLILPTLAPTMNPLGD